MGGGAEEDRQTRVVPCLDSIPDHPHHEMASLPIPDELLAEILLRLPSPADLVRASVGCVSFRRVAAERSFIRRYRKLHPPPLVGLLERSKGFYPAIAPHPSASLASAVASAADFSFSFLPAPVSDWAVRDIRDGRVLLKRFNWKFCTLLFTEAVVCDPLHRQYVLLPPIPAPVEDPIFTDKHLQFEIFLVPAVDSDETSTVAETTFSVIWMAQCRTRLVVFVFSSNTGQWRAVPSPCLASLCAGLSPTSLFLSRHYVYGCFYWLKVDCEESKLLVLDTKTMEFSTAEPPPEANSCFDFTMVEAGKDRPGMFVLTNSKSPQLFH